MQKGTIRSSSRERTRDTSRICLNRRSCQVVGPLPVTRPVSKPKPPCTSSTNGPSKPKERIIHKQTVPGTSGTVEVIVKTQSKRGDSKRSRSSSRDRSSDVPWGEVLQRRTSSETVKPKPSDSGVFSQFDPLRTVHFIADELSRKFDSIDDPTVKQLISDMQVALKRVPREVSSISREDLSLIRQEIKNAMRKEPSDLKSVPSRNNVAPKKENKMIQTLINSKQEILEAEIMQRTFEASLANLESTCRNLETTCVSLRNEKDELQSSLAVGRSKLDELQKALETQQQRNKVLAADSEKFKSERDVLEQQITRLQEQIDSNLSRVTRESKKIITKLREENLNLVREISDTKSTLVSTVFEKDKLSLIVSTKDEQLAQMRCEIDAIQALVQKQFAEIMKDEAKSQPLCSSRSGSVESSSSPPAWDAQMLSSIRNSLSPPIKEASAEVQDLFRNIIQEKALRGDAPSPQLYGSLKVDRSKTKNGAENQSFKELPTYRSDQSDTNHDRAAAKVFDRRIDEVDRASRSIEREKTPVDPRTDAEENVDTTEDLDDMLDKMIDLKSEEDIDRLLEQVKRMAAGRIGGRFTDTEDGGSPDKNELL